MIKALWFMVKVGLLVALVVWIAERPGFVEIEWMAYTLRIHVGLFLLGALGIIMLSIFLYNVIKTFVDFPSSYRRYREVKSFEKGYKALTLGLTAVAAGDTKNAAYQAYRAEKLLPGDTGLPLLLKAQSQRMKGNEEDAQKSFVQLLGNKDAAFLGARGLLQMALDMEDYEHALELARKALAIHPKQPWILKTVYEMELRLRLWDDARKTLGKAQKYNAISKKQAVSDRVAMFHAQAEEQLQQNYRDEAQKLIAQAYKLDKSFEPSIVQFARLTHQSGNRRKAVKLIENAWKDKPHPELVKAWEDLISQDRSKKPLGRVKWFERLLAKNPQTAQGHMAAGRIATEEGLWGEARKHLQKAEEIAPSAQLYRLWAALEDKSTHNEEAVQRWLEKAETAAPVPAWVCEKTGRIYEEWHPIALPHGAFNTIHWTYPQGTGEMVAAKLEKPAMSEAVLEAPREAG